MKIGLEFLSEALRENKGIRTHWQFAAIGADGDTVELGRDVARSRATEERAGK